MVRFWRGGHHIKIKKVSQNDGNGPSDTARTTNLKFLNSAHHHTIVTTMDWAAARALSLLGYIVMMI